MRIVGWDDGYIYIINSRIVVTDITMKCEKSIFLGEETGTCTCGATFFEDL